ncbi:MAG: hypothetical protein JO192_05475 [Candidatus Eremiobacteraeota bacterium]|nr:hypothetical protein [Candidatus Eremiobacteraeota bacterium]
MATLMRRAIAALTTLSLAACAGNGALNASAPTSGMLPSSFGARADSSGRHRKRTDAYAQIVIPRLHHHHRKPDFVSAATRGIQIVATYTGASSSSGAYVQTTVAALGPNAPGCQTSASSFLCLISATVWEGSNHIVVTTYDQPPSGGQIPPTADVIGMAAVDQAVKAGTTPYIPIYLGGQIGKIHVSPLYSTVPADGSNHNVSIVVAPRDFGNQPIKAGKHDPYANPITATLSESGGSGHATLLLNGKASGNTATLKFSADALVVQYDGNGKSGYSIGLSLSATKAPTEKAQVSPLFVDGSGVAAHVLGLNGVASSPTLTITEKDAPAAQTYAVTRSGCGGIVNPSAVSGSGASATFVANGGATASATGCSLSIVDGLYGTTLVLPVTNTPIAGGVTVNGVTITEYAVGAAPGPPAVGPDSHIWFTENGNYFGVPGGNAIASIDPSTGTTTAPIALGGASDLYDLVAGPDGAFWLPDFGFFSLDRVTLSGNLVRFPSPNSNIDCQPGGIASGAGAIWVGGCAQIIEGSLGGGMTQPHGSVNQVNEVAVGPDGAVYWADGTSVDRYDPNTTGFQTYADPNGATIEFLAPSNDGPTGAIWYTSTLVSTTTTSYVNRIDAGGHGALSIRGSVTGAHLYGITAGIDGAVWFTDRTNNKIGRLAFGGTPASLQEFPLPTAGAGPYGITMGGDGSLWFDEATAHNIGHLVP